MPEDFVVRCQTPGEAWLKANPDTDPHKKPLWGTYRGALREAYGQRCGLMGVYVSEGDVDHWVSLKTDRTLAYRWDNYRYLAGVVNSAKKPSWEGHLLDPYAVGADWFEMLLPSCLLRKTDNIPESERARADFTLEKVLNGEYAVSLRREWYECHAKQGVPLSSLAVFAPLVAKAAARASSPSST